MAVTFDGNDYTLYVNGELVHNDTSAAGKTPDSQPVRWIGRVDNSFQGNIDEVRLWNVARTQAEIQAAMNTALTGSESGLLAYYNFDETGTSLTDITGSGYDGTLHGDPVWVISEVPMD